MKGTIKKRNAFDIWNIIIIVFIILILLFIIYPFSTLAVRSVWLEDGTFSFKYYIKFFTSNYYRTALFNSLKVSLLTTVFASLLGIPMAYFACRYKIKGKKILDNLCIIAMLSPPFIGAYAWVMLMGRAGYITTLVYNLTGITLPSIYGLKGILLVFTLKLFPYVYLYVSGALGSMDASLEEAAESLGVHGTKRLITITFPLILPTILSSALMVFMTSLADFGTPAIIGEGFKVLPVLIYNEYVGEMGGQTGLANALSVIIISIALLVMVLQKKAIAGRDYKMSGLRHPEIKTLNGLSSVLVHIFLYGVAFLAILSQLTIAITSFRNTSGPVFTEGFGIGSYIEAFSNLGRAIRNSYMFSFIAIGIIILLSMLLSYLVVRRNSKLINVIDMLVMFPYVIPGAVLGIMLIGAFNKRPLLLTGTVTIMIVSYVIRKMPFTLRSSVGILYQIEPCVEEASISLGVSPIKTFFKITAPMMVSGIVSGAILSWIQTINELSSTMLLYSGSTNTISVAIYNAVTAQANYGVATALATILTVTTIIALAVCNKLSGGKLTF